MIAAKPVLIIPGHQEAQYVNRCGTYLGMFFSHSLIMSTKINSLYDIFMKAKPAKVRHVICTNFSVFKMFAPGIAGTQNDNIGTVIKVFCPLQKDFIRVMLAPSFRNVFTNSGPFLMKHFYSKLASQDACISKPAFTWSFLCPTELETVQAQMQQAKLCAVDIETSKQGLLITSVSYSYDYKGEVITKVIKCDAENYPFCISAMRVLNLTECPKVMQNGRYDCSYFLRFNAPVRNYIYDIYNLQHCLFPELPKDIAFISSMYLDNFQYWKEESSEDLYRYNAKDTHNTYFALLGMLQYIERNHCQYALSNYVIEFPVVFPCISCGMEGVLVDAEEMAANYAEATSKADAALARLQKLIGVEGFNPNSPKQVTALQKALGYKAAGASDKVAMIRWKENFPLVAPIVDAIMSIRKLRKAASTYFDLDLLHGRLMYSLDPAGTDSGRLASKASNFWCGTQVQNIPAYGRKMVKPEPGYKFIAVDKSQSESWCTAFEAREPKMQVAVSTSPDFHCHNASMFFGIPFSELWDISANKTLRKDIRDLSKRVNHGANYNMQESMLLQTMGTRNVLDAGRLLKLPQSWRPVQVTKYLLGRFDLTYPRIRGEWQQELITEIKRTGKLTHESTGWVRRTFMRPWVNRDDLNSAVSHKPQSLSVQLVNKAMIRVWRNLCLDKYKGQLRLKMQVHDELVLVAKEDIAEAAAQDVAKVMVIPITVHGKTFQIPSTIAIGNNWGECK